MILVCRNCGEDIGGTQDERVPENADVACVECSPGGKELICGKCNTVVGTSYDDRVPENANVACTKCLCLDKKTRRQIQARRESPMRD